MEESKDLFQYWKVINLETPPVIPEDFDGTATLSYYPHNKQFEIIVLFKKTNDNIYSECPSQKLNEPPVVLHKSDWVLDSEDDANRKVEEIAAMVRRIIVNELK